MSFPLRTLFMDLWLPYTILADASLSLLPIEPSTEICAVCTGPLNFISNNPSSFSGLPPPTEILKNFLRLAPSINAESASRRECPGGNDWSIGRPIFGKLSVSEASAFFFSAPYIRVVFAASRAGVPDTAQPATAAASTDRCNTGVESFCWRFKLQRFTRPFVELPSDLVQMSLRVHRQVSPFGEVLSEQADWCSHWNHAATDFVDRRSKRRCLSPK